MEEKVIPFDKNIERYRRLADERAEKGDFAGALRLLTSAKSIAPDDLGVITDIADTYADAGLLELSNRFWFIFLDKAPKDRASVAYEELAINFFYMDNFWASSYYFHRKLEVDGFISKEGLSQEIIDFFSGEEQKKGAYKIAYPFDRADYSYEFKKAKHAIAVGAFGESARILNSVPIECLNEEACGDLAVSLFMDDDLDGAEKICRESLNRHGENVTAFCNLSTVYDMKEDFDNSDYYYRKALSCKKGDKAESYKIATCAIEREDHLTVRECLENILDDRPFELTMRFFYGLAFANTGDCQRAEKELSEAYALDPSDAVVKFYLDYCININAGKGDPLDLLPFKYVKDMPEKISDKWKKKINELLKTPEKFASALKRKEWKETLSWGIFSTDSEFMRDCVYILSTCFTPFSKKLMFSALLNPDGREELKRILVYVMIVNGVKEKFGVVAGSFYFKIKPRKLICEKDAVYGGLYTSAYALCMSKIVFFEIDGIDKVGKTCDKIYRKFRALVTDAEATNEEIAALILYECKFKKISDEKTVMQIFSTTKNKLKTLKAMFEGEPDD
ncbi:MAG: tetratricopeptide repeat protein [Clostridia bacterium]|nr:tetratricopeptide repeat protein [Clostridia bacterium]